MIINKKRYFKFEHFLSKIHKMIQFFISGGSQGTKAVVEDITERTPQYPIHQMVNVKIGIRNSP